MLSKIRELILKNIKSNFKIYFFLFMAFVAGISAGAFTVNGLSSMQKEELKYYFQGFLQLLDYQKLDSVELLKIAFFDNIKMVALIWILGVSIIGIPFIFLAIGIRGFITGFSSGFVIEIMGSKGMIFTLVALIPKELILVPCLIALGVSGIKFSMKIIKSKPLKHLSKESLKSDFFAYCMVTLFYTFIIIAGIMVEAYVTPVLIKMSLQTFI